ncbi:CmcI family methyltransferase [Bradyrhizobium sp. NDS-1]|uniref:CmcI family methyltransferase n=1 Tax=Bradyrhizobium sp. NDS-1 TaxID=3080014 RepID=UPI00293E9F61|nr:CmcI family methyltransferase [Bradyrhizobium sp. NDS-1]WOH75658.1 CmcI family methyltransferase [Bradyrhizobium sp. NDS-1]
MKLASGYETFSKTVHENYPDQLGSEGNLGWAMELCSVVDTTSSDRFVKPSARGWKSSLHPKLFPNRSTKLGALALTYKGLMNVKTPFDLALYTRLIWELQPRTILELGSLQGGSGLWFADHMSVLCEDSGEVHSFDLNNKCIHENAKHPLLTFHQVDLADVANFDEKLLMRLPHPWLVIDDAHVQIFSIFSHLDRFLISGDYYVIEDNPLNADKEIIDGLQLVEQSGFLIDTYYTDAFGSNLTCAPNAWLRKS